MTKLKQKNKQYNFSDKNYKELREKCQKVFTIKREELRSGIYERKGF